MTPGLKTCSLLLFSASVVMLLLSSRSDAFTSPSATCTIKLRRNNALTTTTPLRADIKPLWGIGGGNNEEFWKQQQELAKEMSSAASKSLKEEQMEKYQQRLAGLVSDSAFYSVLIFCLIWLVAPNPFTALSYAFGAAFGTAYSYGLGKYVETLGGSAADTENVQGAGVGQARFAFLILLFIIVGKFRSQGLQEIPAIAGFFTYQLASLSQGLREYND